MNPERMGPRPLREIELEVEAEALEWKRQRLQQKLQEEANRHGEVFPPQQAESSASTAPKRKSAKSRRAH